MTVPGVGREHQAGLDEMARSFIQAREGMTFSKDWDRRVERDAQEVERQRARAEERERRACRRSRSKTVSGRGKGVDWGWGGDKRPSARSRKASF
jgi:hypothetical protein